VDIDGAVDMASTLTVAGTGTFTGLVDAAIIDGANFKINGGQGSDGQVLTSTGSGVAWEDAGGLNLIDEDNMATNSATRPPSQQSTKAYVDSLTAGNIVTTGALNSGSITSGFGTINNGSSTITTSGAVATGVLTTTGDMNLSGELNLGADTAYIDFASVLNIRAAASTPAYELSIQCVKDSYVSLHYNGATKLATSNTGISVTGAIVASGDITAFSDLRIKDNLEVIPDALSKVEQLNGYTYTRKDLEDKEEKYTGVIAQEVLKVLPEAVLLGETPEDNMAVAYGNMVGLLIEAVKELSDKVKELEGK
jgi:hypothetical protein